MDLRKIMDDYYNINTYEQLLRQMSLEKSDVSHFFIIFL